MLKGVFYSVLIMSKSRSAVMLLDSLNKPYRHEVIAKMKKPSSMLKRKTIPAEIFLRAFDCLFFIFSFF